MIAAAPLSQPTSPQLTPKWSQGFTMTPCPPCNDVLFYFILHLVVATVVEVLKFFLISFRKKKYNFFKRNCKQNQGEIRKFF